jgi:hypothetical protein
MRTSRIIMALLVVTPAGLWLVREQASLGRALVFAAGAALVAAAWTALPAMCHDAPPTAPTRLPAAHHSRADRRIARRPRGRLIRDVRCPASRATAPARRSTRR